MRLPARRLSRPLLAAATAAATAAALAGCAGEAGPPPGQAQPPATASPAAVSGPLCDMLPQGTEPGGPELLRSETPDVALQWIPVATMFEAAVRASGLDAELAEDPAVTLLVPTDDAFDAVMSEDVRDELLLFDHDELRDLLEHHVVEGAHSLADLVAAGTVRTRAGDELDVTVVGDVVRFGDVAETACADYVASSSRLHVIGGVLGDVPGDGGGHDHHS